MIGVQFRILRLNNIARPANSSPAQWQKLRLRSRNKLPIIAVRRLNGPTQPQPDPNPVPVDNEVPQGQEPIPKGAWKGTAFKMAESALTTFASIAILGSVKYLLTFFCSDVMIRSNFPPSWRIYSSTARFSSVTTFQERQQSVTFLVFSVLTDV